MEPPTASPRSRCRLTFWRAVFAALGLIVLLGVLKLYYPPDDPPPDLSEFRDLTYTPLQLLDDQNAYPLLSQAAALLNPTFKTATANHEPEFMTRGVTWDAAKARQWLEHTEPVWPLWEQAALAPRSQMPLAGPTDLDPNLEGILSLADLVQIRVRTLAEDGQTDAALQALLVNLQATTRIEETRSSLWITLTSYGKEKKVSALQALPAIATRANATTAELRLIMEGLESIRPSQASAVFSLQNNYQRLNTVFDEMTTYSLFGYVSLSHPPAPAPSYQRFGLALPLTFKPNRTRSLFLEGMHRAIGAIDLNVAQLTDIARDWRATAIPVGKMLRVPLDNLFGSMALGIADPFDGRFLYDRLEEQSRISAAQAFLALLLYHREHGELPATLDALVPAYLPAVPRDYYSGQPIRYSRDFRAVWSVGMDHFNVTSAAPFPKPENNDEIYLPLDFAAPAAPGSAGGPPAL